MISDFAFDPELGQKSFPAPPEGDPLVSVTCLAYNQEAYIESALQGFLSQETSFPFEILIHDDASSDQTPAIIKRYADAFPKQIFPILQQENQAQKRMGSIMARFNLPRARGKYLAFCDGDDFWKDPHKLQAQVEFMEKNPEFGVCCTDFDIYYERTDTTKEALFRTNPAEFPIYTEVKAFLLSEGFMAPSTWLIRKEILKHTDFTKSRVDGTYALMMDFLGRSKVHVLDKSTTVYRFLRESSSHTKSILKQFKRYQGLYQIQLEYMKKYPLKKKWRDFLKNRFRTRVLELLLAEGPEVEKAQIITQLMYDKRICKQLLSDLEGVQPLQAKLEQKILLEKSRKGIITRFWRGWCSK